jgi:hypothetical protein
VPLTRPASEFQLTRSPTLNRLAIIILLVALGPPHALNLPALGSEDSLDIHSTRCRPLLSAMALTILRLAAPGVS